MPEKPVLDYEPKPLVSERRRVVGSIALTATCTLAAPSVVFAFGDIVLGIVRRHWLAGYQFDQFLEVALVCDVIGLILASVAIGLGKVTPGGLLLLFHLFSLFLLPSLGYA